DGHRPATWPNPEQALQSQQFWNVFEACLTVLPAKTSRVFMMREFLGFEAEEICTQLGITMSN
ncbi:RNA polymerase subunit sigma, partial [Escherichia coli]|nr:RNA polymerase subunit sigma [Escherichia coli]